MNKIKRSGKEMIMRHLDFNVLDLLTSIINFRCTSSMYIISDFLDYNDAVSMRWGHVNLLTFPRSHVFPDYWW